MSDLDDPALADWIRAACTELGLSDERVDVTAIHALTAEVSQRVARPMAPVSALLLGLAVGSGMDAGTATQRLLATLP